MLLVNEFISKINTEVIRYGDCVQLRKCEIDAARVTAGACFIAINPSNYNSRDGGLGLTGNEDSAFGLGGFDDGHRHLDLALSNGASILIVEDEIEVKKVPKKITILKCSSTINAAAFLAQTLIKKREHA